MASPDDINSTLQGIASNIAGETTAIVGLGTTVATAIGTANAALIIALAGIATAVASSFLPVVGTFTLSNATVTVVTQSRIQTGGFPTWTPTNFTAALTLRTLGLYLSAVTAGTSFSVSTQTGLAAGTETFSYRI